MKRAAYISFELIKNNVISWGALTVIILRVLVTQFILCLGWIPLHAQTVPKIYFLDSTNNRLMSANLDGSALTALFTGAPLSTPHGLALDTINGHAYLTNTNTDEVYRVDIDGNNLVALVNAGLAEPIGMELDVSSGYFYISDRGLNQIRRYNLDGSNATVSLTWNLNQPHNFELDTNSGKFYIANRNAGNIIKTDLSGDPGVGQLLVTNLNQPYDVALDLSSNHLYLTEFGASAIKRYDLDGTNAVTIVTGLNLPTGLQLDASNGHLYFTEWGGQKIRRVDTDGSNLTDILGIADGLGSMTDLVIYNPPSSSNNSDLGINYIPFRSESILFLMLAVTGVWLVARPGKSCG